MPIGLMAYEGFTAKKQMDKTEKALEFIVFGATGDLSQRKLFPALFQLFTETYWPSNMRILGVVRNTMSLQSFASLMRPSCLEKRFFDGERSAQFETFVKHIELVLVEANEPDSFKSLKTRLSVNARQIFYFAVSPMLYEAVIKGLVQQLCVNASSRVVIEKPIGEDLPSAESVHKLLKSVFKEHQIFRIDHYLGKETVQNIMALRFGNAILEPLWRAERIDYIQITVAETLGVENRGEYYDQTGALRDMVQNHLLQLLCITAMEPPSQLSAYSVRDEKLKVLSALRPIVPGDVVTQTVRGQYVGDEQHNAYVEEMGVAPGSHTETFVALKAQIDNWRWAGMPIYLRTGKKLKSQRSEILIQFKDVPHQLFGRSSSSSLKNRLLIALQPEESIQLYLNCKARGKGMSLEPVALHLDREGQSAHARNSPLRSWGAYERLILDVLQGDLTLFMREKEVSAAWQWVDPIIEGWQQSMNRPEPYPAGTWGPVTADQLLARDGYIWHNHA